MAQFQFALILLILKIGVHLGTFRLDGAERYADDNMTNIKTARAQEKDTRTQIPQIARKANPPHQIQGLKGGGHLWSSHSQTLAITPASHPSRDDAEHFTSCAPYHWPCADGFMCILVILRCDGKADCTDDSDESESLCTPPCPTDMFVCADGLQCVHESLKCDGIYAHCEDGSDESEALCTPPCSNDMFTCADGLKCIPNLGICDPFGFHHCDDGSDESESLCNPPCSTDMFACADGLKCIHQSRKCDRTYDCEDGSDESISACPFLSICSDDQFACAHGKKCIHESLRCDGRPDCEDESDESESVCSPPCSNGLFACADGLQCISESKVCDGFSGGLSCNDGSNSFASQCDNCTADRMFKCPMAGFIADVCLDAKFKCDGDVYCIDFTDELVSECPDCVEDPFQFTCIIGGQMVCLSKYNYQCDGLGANCDDGSDEDPASCNNCSQPGQWGDRAMCRDGSTCFSTSVVNQRRCGGEIDCTDGSDESDTYSQCNYCTEEGYLPCPGFPENCGKLCDGRATCPDRWDELLSICRSYSETDQSNESEAAICSEEAGLYQCKDGSMCLSSEQVCNNEKDCADGSDEDSVACKDKCSYIPPYFRHDCDNGSCIPMQLLCSAQNQPLCTDGSDMVYCDKCYNIFPEKQDPYRWPCANSPKKCILQTSRCDGVHDCEDGSDESNCPLVTQIDLIYTLLICLALMTLLWLIYFSIAAFSESPQDTILFPSNSDPTVPDQAVPSFLLHPALSDMDNQSWNWQEVGEQLRLEVVFFNRDPQVLFDFLNHIEARDAHPDNVHKAFTGFYNYMTSKGYDHNAVAVSMRQTIGHHRLAHMALKGPPNFIDRKVYKIGRWLIELETKGKVYNFLINFLRFIQASMSPFLFFLDYLKDFILCLILRETVRRMEEICVNTNADFEYVGYNCLAASGTEKDILTAILITFCVSLALTSIDSFLLRKKFFKTNLWLDLIFAIISPLLLAIYFFRLSHMSYKLKKKKSKLRKDALMKKISWIENLFNSVQTTKEAEVSFEAIMQIFLLLSLACFNYYMSKAPSGQTYSYFFGVALLVLKGNLALYLGSLFISFLGPCWFHVNRTNFLRHGSLNMSRKLVLMTRNVLFLLVRVSAITSTIFIPVIRSWDTFIKNEGIDATSALDNWRFQLEFQKHFSKGLDRVTADIRTNALFFGLFLFIHFALVTSYGIFRSAKFSKGSIKEQAIYLISTFSLPLPFLTIKGVDGGEEKAELWFLVVLHSLENFLIVLASRVVYMQSNYPLGIIVFDCVLVLVNILAVLVSVFYVKKMELFAGLPQDLPSSLSTFTLEDIACVKDGFGPDETQSVKIKATSPSQEAAPTAGLDNSSYDRSKEVDGECTDEGQKSLLQILPTNIKKSLNADSVIVEKEVTDSKKDITSAAEKVCIEKTETVGKEGDDPNKKVTKTLEKEEVDQRKKCFSPDVDIVCGEETQTFEDKEVTFS